MQTRHSLYLLCVCVCVCMQGLEGEDEGAISMLSDNTAKLTSAVRYWTRREESLYCGSVNNNLSLPLYILLNIVIEYIYSVKDTGKIQLCNMQH